MTEPTKPTNTTTIVLIVVAVVLLLSCGGFCCIGMIAGFGVMNFESRMVPPERTEMERFPPAPRVAPDPTPEEWQRRVREIEESLKPIDAPSIAPPGGAPPENDPPSP